MRLAQIGGAIGRRTRRNRTVMAETMTTKVELLAMEFTGTKRMRTGGARASAQRRTTTEQTVTASTEDLRRTSQMMFKIPRTKKMDSKLEPMFYCLRQLAA